MIKPEINVNYKHVKLAKKTWKEYLVLDCHKFWGINLHQQVLSGTVPRFKKGSLIVTNA